MIQADSAFYAFLAHELLKWDTLLKMAVAISIVLILSVLAEVVSPRFAGVLSGYPLGAAISLFFIGWEISPEFAARSALYTMVGLVATQAFAYFYYWTSSLARGMSKRTSLLLSSLGGVSAYFVAALLLRPLDLTLLTALLLPSFSIVAFIIVFRKIENIRILNKVKLSGRVLLFRSLFAAVVILLITSTAKLVGSRWAGLFSAFPTTMLPLVMLIHYTYGTEHVHAVLKNVPRGLGSLVVYSLVLYKVYPVHGVFIGTLIAYLFATLYLIVIHLRLPKALLTAAL